MTEPPKFLAAAVQLNAGTDKRANLDKAERFIADAARHGAKLVVLPEVFLWRGPQAEEASIAEDIPGPASERLCALCRKLGVHLVAGSILERAGDGDRVYNTSVLVDDAGEIKARYRKVHLFDIDLQGSVSVRESDTRRGGDAVVSVPTPLGTIALSICYDLRFPELYRKAALAGAEIIAIPSAFTFPTGAAHWEVLVRARAIENLAYVIAANQIGAGASGILNYGNSMIVDPWGKPLAHAPDREGAIFAEIDREYQQRLREQLPCLSHVRLSDRSDGSD
jgi:predicted amidohydrolase